MALETTLSLDIDIEDDSTELLKAVITLGNHPGFSFCGFWKENYKQEIKKSTMKAIMLRKRTQ